MMVSLVKYTAVIGCATYITRKLLNRKQILLCKAKVALALLFVAEVLVTCLLRQHVSSISIFSMVGLSVGLHWILDRDNLGGIVTATILGYGISYLCFLVGLICIGTLYRMGVQALGDFTPFNAIIIGIIQMGMGFLLFRIKRLSHGLPFLADSQYGDIGVYLSVSILLVVSLGGSMAKSYIIIQFICYTLIICGTSLWFWWKRRMEREYKDQIRKREQARLQAAVTALQDQVAALRAENETFSRIIHRDNKLIPAMELAVQELLQAAGQGQAQQESAQALLAQLHQMSQERAGVVRSYEQAGVSLPRTGVAVLDALFSYLGQKAAGEGITLRLCLPEDTPALLRVALPEQDAATLLADLVENAIIAVRAAGGPGRVMVELVQAEGCPSIRVSDSGVPFPPEVAANWGVRRVTTHGDEGGSGIGLMSTYEICQRHRASFSVQALPTGGPYTKTVTVRFDGGRGFHVDGSEG